MHMNGLCGCGVCVVVPRVTAAVEAVDRGFDSDHGLFGRGWAVEDKCAGKVGAVGGEAERLPAAPAETRDKQLLFGGGKPAAVVGSGVGIGRALVGRQLAA